ncbi:hypothetical protein CXF97_05295 [Pseudomonas sp. Choline-02u-1]|nr:hypothetical protein CXF97_05295 [Pseudomonas sp. Choline-02u-1]
MKLKLALSPGFLDWNSPFEPPTSIPESGRRTRRSCSTCGSGLAREEGVSVNIKSSDTPPSRASPLPQKSSTLRSQRRN